MLASLWASVPKMLVPLLPVGRSDVPDIPVVGALGEERRSNVEASSSTAPCVVVPMMKCQFFDSRCRTLSQPRFLLQLLLSPCLETFLFRILLLDNTELIPQFLLLLYNVLALLLPF